MDDRRQHTRVDARAENRRRHRDGHGKRADREHGLSRGGDPPVVIAVDAVFGHCILHGFPFADEIKHHHRVREQRHHRREDPVCDVTRDIAAAQADGGSREETGKADEHGREQRLSQQQIIPSPFVIDWIARVAGAQPAPRRALDLAMGRGRHALPLARAAFDTFGVDIRFDAVRDAVVSAAAEGFVVRGWCADLTRHPLPPGRFDLVVVSRYLQRDLFRSIADTLKAGGVLLYETFTTAQLAHGVGPRSPDHLLLPGELRGAFADLEILFYEEVISPEAVARLAAKK